MRVLLALLLFAETQKNPAPPASERFAQVSKQAAKAREQDRVEEALRLYREAIRLHPNWPEGWWYLGTLLYDQDRYEEGRAAMRRFTALEAKSAPGWAMLGLCEYEVKAYDAALTHIERGRSLGLQGNPSLNTVARYHAALLLTRLGQFEAAIDILMDFARSGEDKPAMVEAAGIAAMREPLLPADVPESERELILQVGRAVMDVGNRRAAQAQAEFAGLIARYPGMPQVHYLYGSFLLLSDPDTALAEFQQTLALSPRHVPAMLQMAFEYLRRGDGAEALPFARQAAEIDPRSFAAHNALGRALADSGDLENGIRELELSKQQSPGSPQTRIALASAYAKAGRNTDAARERAEFLKLKQLTKKPGEP
jgi:tetratricopeptide (TPR) repeat protein